MPILHYHYSLLTAWLVIQAFPFCELKESHQLKIANLILPVDQLLYDNQRNGAGTIKITMGGAYSVVYNFKNSADGGYPLSGLIQATDGYLFGITNSGTYTFKIRATDNDTPPLYDEEQIKVTITNAFTATNFSDESVSNHFQTRIFPNPADDELNISSKHLQRMH